jgi:hypothetical protein
MRYGVIILLVVLAFLAVIAASVRRRAAAGSKPKSMSQAPIDKEQKVREIYDRAKEKIARLRKERREITERFVKKADEIRLEQAKKRLNEL